MKSLGTRGIKIAIEKSGNNRKHIYKYNTEIIFYVLNDLYKNERVNIIIAILNEV